jgi:hypothetical protein
MGDKTNGGQKARSIYFTRSNVACDEMGSKEYTEHRQRNLNWDQRARPRKPYSYCTEKLVCRPGRIRWQKLPRQTA